MSKRFVFIDDEIFLSPSTFRVLESLQKDASTTILLDLKMEQRAREAIKEQQFELGYTLQSYFNLIESHMKHIVIEDEGSAKIQKIYELLPSNAKLDVYSNRRSIIEMFHSEKNFKGELVYYQLTDAGFEAWNLDQLILVKPFTVDQDYYHVNVSIDKIKSVYSPKYGYLMLNTDTKTIGAGGEGIVYKTYRNFRCKLYRTKYQTYLNHKKLKDMLSLNISNDYIVWPKDVVYYQNTFVGYVMDDITNAINLDESRDLSFRQFSYLQRFKIALEFLRHIEYLHQRQVIIGDMKFENVLVKDEDNVYIIDSGSFQVLDYPCPVFTKGFTNISYTSERLKTQLRQKEEEYFAINKIIFEIMIGKSPFYSENNNEIDIDNPQQLFSYDVNLPKSSSLREDQKLWYSLPKEVREYFNNYFNQNIITYVEEWTKSLNQFIRQLEASA
jgi:hypothetical protein